MPRGGIFEGSESMAAFAKRNKALAGKIQRNAELQFRRLFIAIGAAVIPATPVDTGHARNNWLSSTGTPKSGTPNAASAAAADAVLENTNVGVALKLDETAYIANNVPYIGRLNAGHSQQAPAGFIERAEAAGRATIKELGLL